MNKKEIDHYYQNNINILLTYADKYIKKVNSRIDSNEIVNNCYLYLINSKEDIRSIEAFSKDYIKNQIRWSNSENNRSIKKTNTFKEKWECGENINSFLIEQDINIGSNLTEDTLYYNELNNSVLEFNKMLSLNDRGVLSIYMKGIDTVDKMSRYLNISKYGAYSVIKEAKEIWSRFEEFIKNKYII